ncbi:MAG: hypothetical protein ACLGI6_18825, partial [Gammaproteobacteria bacterium]
MPTPVAQPPVASQIAEGPVSAATPAAVSAGEPERVALLRVRVEELTAENTALKQKLQALGGAFEA